MQAHRVPPWRWACLTGACWDLSHLPNRRDPTHQLKPGTVAPRCGEDNMVVNSVSLQGSSLEMGLPAALGP